MPNKNINADIKVQSVEAGTLGNLVSGESITTSFGKIRKAISQLMTNTTALNSKASTSALSSHTTSTSNPHGVTKSQVGLGNVDNTSDLSKPVSTATQT